MARKLLITPSGEVRKQLGFPENYGYTAATAVKTKRGTKVTFDIGFLDDNGSLLPHGPAADSGGATTTVVEISVKPTTKYDSSAIFAHGTVSGPPDGSGYFRFSFYLSNEVIDEYLLVNSNDSDDKSSIFCMCDIRWSVSGDGDTNEDWDACGTFGILIDNNVTRSEDATPLSLPTPEDWLDDLRPLPLALSSVPTNGVSMVWELGLSGESCTVDGDIVVTFTCDSVNSGSPITLTVPILSGDNDEDITDKVKTALEDNVLITDKFAITALSLTQIRLVKQTNGNSMFSLQVTDPDEIMAFGPIDAVEIVAGVASNAVAIVLDQAAVVSHSDGTFTKWACADLVPIVWLPCTAGIIYNRALNQWERLYIDGTLKTEILPDQ